MAIAVPNDSTGEHRPDPGEQRQLRHVGAVQIDSENRGLAPVTTLGRRRHWGVHRDDRHPERREEDDDPLNRTPRQRRQRAGGVGMTRVGAIRVGAIRVGAIDNESFGHGVTV